MKRTFRTVGITLGLLFAGLLTAASAAETKTIKVGIGYKAASSQLEGLKKFKELVEARSDGRLEVEIVDNARLGRNHEAMRSLRAGTLEMTMPETTSVVGLDKKWLIFGLPFLFSSEEVADEVLDGPFGQDFLDSLSEHGIIGLAFWERGFHALTNSAREVKSPADMDGLKIDMAMHPFLLASLRAMGADLVQAPDGRLFSALRQKTIDGQQTLLLWLARQPKLFEVQKFTTIYNHFYLPLVFMYSKRLWDELDKQDQDVILAAAREARLVQRQINRDTVEETIEGMKRNGMTVTRLTPEQHNAFVEATKGVASKYEADLDADNLKALMAEIARAQGK